MTVTNTNPTDHHKLNSAPKETGTEPLTSADEIFNEETLEALEEAELIAAHPENYKSYHVLTIKKVPKGLRTV